MAAARQNGNGNGMNAAQANMMARNLLVAGAVRRTQQIYGAVSAVTVAGAPVVLNIAPRNVGMILGFIINVRANVAVAACTGSPLTKTPFGPMNLLSQVEFLDLNNNTRIQTTGWHIGLLNGARSNWPWAASRTNTTYPVDFGNNVPNIARAGDTIAAGANSDVAWTYYVPLAYSDQDLRGAVYANVVNATMNLRLTLNNNFAQARTQAGGSDAVYVTATSGTAVAGVTTAGFTVEVYQVYYDQLPFSDKGPILPLLDLGVIYDIKTTARGNLLADQDFPIPYSNFRDFLSTFAVYRNRAAASGAVNFANEADINYWALESANYTNLFKVTPLYATLWARQVFEDDPPLGVYYFASRTKPVSTTQYGNMSLVLNPDDVQTGASVLLGYEAFALSNTVGAAASLNVG